MRPTDLQFRPTREKTPGPQAPSILTRDGSQLLKINKVADTIHPAFNDDKKLNKPGFGSSVPRKIGFSKTKDYKS